MTEPKSGMYTAYALIACFPNYSDFSFCHSSWRASSKSVFNLKTKKGKILAKFSASSIKALSIFKFWKCPKLILYFTVIYGLRWSLDIFENIIIDVCSHLKSVNKARV